MPLEDTSSRYAICDRRQVQQLQIHPPIRPYVHRAGLVHHDRRGHRANDHHVHRRRVQQSRLFRCTIKGEYEMHESEERVTRVCPARVPRNRRGFAKAPKT